MPNVMRGFQKYLYYRINMLIYIANEIPENQFIANYIKWYGLIILESDLDTEICSFYYKLGNASAKYAINV